MDLTTATPVEIDTVIAAIYVRWYEQCAVVQQQAGYRDDIKKTLDQVDAGTYRYAWQEKYDRPKYERMLAERTERVQAEQAKAAEIMRETAPYNEEYKRRGGWTRFYLVDNGHGHVHSSMHCTTCYPTTQFIWLPEQSGSTEAETVALAGEQACTVCFPSAPVDVLKRKGGFEAPARKAARQEREEKKAATLAKKQAKALYPEDVDKALVVRGDQRFPEKLRTIAAAKSFLTDGYSWGWGTHPMYSEADRDMVAEVLAERLGTDPFAERQAAEKRAAKRR
jgi:hypothetical protein